MTYLEELRENWRPLLAATIGLSCGMSVFGTITSTIAPSLIADQHWSKADFALVGSLALLTAFAFPFVGRLTDLIGVRMTALIGQIALPLLYVATSMIDGALSIYVAIFAVQSLICVTTTSTVYTRLAVQGTTRARGLALAIVASGPAVASLVIAPLLNSFVEAHGWRASYQASAIFTAVAGAITFLLIPSRAKKTVPAATSRSPRRAREDYPVILRTPAFWILVIAMLLCNLPQTLLLVQLKMLLLDHGVTGASMGMMLSTVSVGMLMGRFLTGIALDRFEPQIVSVITLCLPSVGLLIIASSFASPPLLTFAILCLGFASGAEGDVVGFLVAKYFGVEIYSSVLGLLTCVMAFSTASGAALLSVTMARTGGFTLYLLICAVAVIAGAMSLLLLRSGSNISRRRGAADSVLT